MRQNDPRIESIAGFHLSAERKATAEEGSLRAQANPSTGPWGDRPSDAWLCTGDETAACSRGPKRNGECCQQGANQEVCLPSRRWTHFRRQFSTTAALIGAGVLLIALGGPWRRELFAPGPLSTPHAQILGGNLKNERCAACHAITKTSWADWFGSGGNAHQGVTQNDLCMNCHHQRIPPKRSELAHNLSPAELQAIWDLRNKNGELNFAKSGIGVNRFDEQATDTSSSLDCAACHREHGGEFHNLTAMSTAACQSCHRVKYAHFADDHPDWKRWPSDRTGAIAFDHKSHLGHFAKKETEFHCQKCHTPSSHISLAGTAGVTLANSNIQSRTGLVRSPDFESACAACHEAPLSLKAADGFALIQLPMLDALALEASDEPITWPDTMQEAEPFQIPPLMEWLLANNPETRQAIHRLQSPRYMPWANEPTPSENAAVLTIARETLALLRQLAVDPYDRINQQLPQQNAKELLAFLPQALFGDAVIHWIDMPPHTSLSEEPFKGAGEQRVEAPTATAELPPGWYRDDRLFKIGYRGGGHADPVLKSLCELAAAPTTPETLRESLRSIPAISSCFECHPMKETSQNMVWFHQGVTETFQSLTRFSHLPHLNIQLLADCRHCHVLKAEGGAANFAEGSLASGATSVTPSFHLTPSFHQGIDRQSDFHLVGKQTCVTCHRPGAAGDSCTQCHRYHALFPTGDFLPENEHTEQPFSLREAQHEGSPTSSNRW